MPSYVDLSPQEITVPVVVRNASPARLYEDALTRERAGVVSSGAIAIRSGAKTGRSTLFAIENQKRTFGGEVQIIQLMNILFF